MGIVPGATRPDHRDQLCPRGLPLQMPPAPSYITHFWEPLLNAPNSPGEVFLDHYETVTLLESRTTIESGTTGMRTWLASFVLADFISQRPDIIKNKRILELGSGIGFLGIILSRMQNLYPGERQALWLTDVNDNVLQRCQENLKMPCNKTSASNIGCRFLDWSDALDDDRITAFHRILVEEIDADIIFGADIIFDPSLIPALTATLYMALQPGRQATSKVAIIAATVRNEETLAKFVEDAGRKPLQVQELSSSAQDVSFTQDVDKDAKNVKIFQITL
ncbi:hypothetical protein H0H93_005781 [Arthromyces matolae]|nr:hypothetical protein H0H93_005781 [Arthromyces matolae]